MQNLKKTDIEFREKIETLIKLHVSVKQSNILLFHFKLSARNNFR